jgi:endoribonuclease Dicer
MRKNSVSNRVLLARAKEIGLERFLTSEPSAMRKWRPSYGEGRFVDGVWLAERKFARRSLQDCMESLLGVSFLSGGIDMALQAGTALRLCFGGTEPWARRYQAREVAPIPPFFKGLQQALGYQFTSGELLMEAVTHPSFQSDNACYQRLEFLGDGTYTDTLRHTRSFLSLFPIQPF